MRRARRRNGCGAAAGERHAAVARAAPAARPRGRPSGAPELIARIDAARHQRHYRLPTAHGRTIADTVILDHDQRSAAEGRP